MVLARFEAVLQAAFPLDSSGDAAFAYAVELYLRSIPDLDVAVDGWRLVQLVDETDESVRIVGIMTVLPTGDLPIELKLSRNPNSTNYWLRIGLNDARWQSLSASKSWTSVYLYATGERAEAWNWSIPINGVMTT